MPAAMPQNHARTLREHTPLSRRAKQCWSLTAFLLIAGATALILLTSGAPTRRGCINTYLPGVIGVQTYSECGNEARHTCATVRSQQRQFGTVGVLIIEKACMKGQLPVG
jgi:hypothetical protein